jgi:hypothetical protein
MLNRKKYGWGRSKVEVRLKVFVSEKGFRRRTELALKILRRDGLAQIRPELYRLMPDA